MTLTVNGTGDHFPVPVGYNADDIVCTGDRITSITNSDCTLL